MQRTRANGCSRSRLELQAKRRRAGFASAQLLVALGMLGLGVVSLDAISLGAAATIDAQHQKSQALALAQGQMQLLRSLPYEDVQPTRDFQPAPWVALPDLPTGSVSIRIDEASGDTPVFEQLYTVSWRVTDRPGTSGSMRDVELRVSWLAPGAAQRSVELSAWRVR